MDRYVGEIVLNYRLEQKLGEGGYGMVYRARHADLGREVAIKILRADHSRDPAVVDRFLREARLVCTIGHPAIVVVENAGRLRDGEPFYVMELVPGRSLAQRLAQGGPLGANGLARVFGAIAEALDAAHAKGIIHRDLKPHNVMIVEHEGEITSVKLLDFGIAKLLESDDASSQTGGMMGTPHFMPPEQARDAKNVDVRADVYSFGAMFFAAATGRRPFEGGSVTEVLIAVQQDPAPSLARFLPAAPPSLVDAVAACLEKRPDDRPPSVRAAWHAIERGLEDLPTDALPIVRPPASGTAATMTATASDTPSVHGSIDSDDPTRAPTPARHGRVVVIASGVAIAATLAITAFAMRGGRTRGAAPPTTTSAREVHADARMIAPPIPEAPAPVDAGAVIPDVPTPPDAALDVSARPDAAPSPRHVHSEREHPPTTTTTTTTTTTPPTPTPPPTPAAHAPVCTKASFAVLYEAAAPDHDAVRAALRRLRDCRASDLLTVDEFTRLQTALVAKL